MFWPTDDAIRGLPQDLKNRLLDPVHVGDLIRFIQYHVVTQIQVSVQRTKVAEKFCFFIFCIYPNYKYPLYELRFLIQSCISMMFKGWEMILAK